jgi:hypothetical protein
MYSNIPIYGATSLPRWDIGWIWTIHMSLAMISI